ncbi:MAG: hypothetical protein H0W74_07740 [Sphingosinicella sp.]|nr:hypothetical protein [Sphingosinicella sp.]
MLYVMLYNPDKSADRSAHVRRTTSKVRELSEDGKLIITGGLAGREHGAVRITLASGRCSVERGPNGKSSLFDADGFAVLEAKDLEGAIELGREFIEAAGDGELELIQLYSPPPA